MLSYQQQSPSVTQQNPAQTQSTSQDQQNNAHIHQLQQQQPAVQTMRLRDEPPPITPTARPSRKRKSPPSNNTESVQPTQPPQPQQQQQQQPIHVLPPPHSLIHSHIPPGYQYAPTDYTPGGMPPNVVQGSSGVPHQQSQSPPPGAGGRALSSSKRAEQNRKAQRAFRERRDQHVKALESRSQLLDAALASADEANRRWEECRVLVDQLRVENAALRAALSQAQLLPSSIGAAAMNNNNGAHSEEAKQLEASNELKNDSAEATSEKKE